MGWFFLKQHFGGSWSHPVDLNETFDDLVRMLSRAGEALMQIASLKTAHPAARPHRRRRNRPARASAIGRLRFVDKENDGEYSRAALPLRPSRERRKRYESKN
jgi:hypothetical protein